VKNIQAFAAACLILAACWPGQADASQSDQLQLPVQLSAGCLACHDGAGVSSTVVPAAVATELTVFGEDWLNFGRDWNPEIAAAYSDADGCSNGFELGDTTGNWEISDGYLTVDVEMNPAEAGDCTLPVDERSFGVLKSLFGD
jgi:hypothetical protein